MRTPRRPSSSISVIATLPRFAYTRMLRAISEMPIAMNVCSVDEKPIAAAISRPLWRAATMSASRSINSSALSDTRTSLGRAQPRERFVEIERGRDIVEREPELDHRERDLGLDADDHGLGAAQPRRVRDALDRPRRERVENVEHADVDDDAARSEAADALRELVAEPYELLVGKRGMDRRDQDVALLEDRDRHYASSARTSLLPSSCSASSIPPCT